MGLEPLPPCFRNVKVRNYYVSKLSTPALIISSGAISFKTCFQAYCKVSSQPGGVCDRI